MIKFLSCYSRWRPFICNRRFHFMGILNGYVPTGKCSGSCRYMTQDATATGIFISRGIEEFGMKVYLSARRSRPLVLEKVFEGMAFVYFPHRRLPFCECYGEG